MKLSFCILFIFFSFHIKAQEFGVDKTFHKLIQKAYGDLNKDKIPDLVIVTQDTISETAPYRIEVYFTEKDSTRTKIISSTTAILEQYPNGRDGMKDGGFYQVEIKKGVLWIEEEFIRGHMEHKFRFQNNKFELIGFHFVDGGSCCIQIIDFNLSTGKRIEENGTIDQEKLDKKVTTRKISPLPNLADFEVLSGEYY